MLPQEQALPVRPAEERELEQPELYLLRYLHSLLALKVGCEPITIDGMLEWIRTLPFMGNIPKRTLTASTEAVMKRSYCFPGAVRVGQAATGEAPETEEEPILLRVTRLDDEALTPEKATRRGIKFTDPFAAKVTRL